MQHGTTDEVTSEEEEEEDMGEVPFYFNLKKVTIYQKNNLKIICTNTWKGL